MKRIALLSVFLFTVFSAVLFITPPSGAEPGTMTEITPGVWFREGEQETKGHCNNIVIEMAEYLIVVDANFPSGAEALMADIKRVSSKPVKYVFDTHHHGDHAYANPLWTQWGAKTLGYVGVVEEMSRYEPQRWQQTAEQRWDVAELGLDTAEPPRQTFTESPFVLEDESRRVEFHFFGWAHTRGDGFAFLPKEKILCTGDAIVNGPFNYTGDGNTGNWPNVVAAAEKLDFETILPGHGAPAGRELAAGQRTFFEELGASVRQAHQAGKSLEDIVELKDGAGVSTAIKLSDEVSTWVGDRFAEQVRVAYQEIALGKPHGEILGGK